MKKIITLFAVIIFGTATFAQQQLATLLHNDSIRVFYGENALQSAHAAAVNGDVITLSEGTFNSVNITKAVTIRGAGMFADPVARTMPTILNGNFTITVPQDSTYWLTLEGIFHNQTVFYHTVYNPQFIKCRFYEFGPQNNVASNLIVMNNARYINCIIKIWRSHRDNNIWRSTGTQFINSVILDGVGDCPTQLHNCVAKLNYYDAGKHTISNSIVYCNGDGFPSNNYYTSFNTIGINTNTSGGYNHQYFDPSGLSSHSLWYYPAYNQVFKTFNGTYTDGVPFELRDDVAALRLGTDSTQVGIYGGQCPFDPSVRNPLIGRATVGRTTTSDGKLEVEIQVLPDSDNQ